MKLTIILSVIVIVSVLLMLYSAVALVQNKRFFTTAPKDIQEVIQKKPERFNGAHILGYILLFISILGVAGAFLYGAENGIQNAFSFWQFFARFITMLYLYKAFDIIFFDWFLLTKSHFFQHYYPETEGCKGYHNFGFNKKSQTIEIIVYLFAALLGSFICTIIAK